MVMPVSRRGMLASAEGAAAGVLLPSTVRAENRAGESVGFRLTAEVLDGDEQVTSITLETARLGPLDGASLTTGTFSVHAKATSPIPLGPGDVISGLYDVDRQVTAARLDEHGDVVLDLRHGEGQNGCGTLGYLTTASRNLRLNLVYTITQRTPIARPQGGTVTISSFIQGQLSSPSVSCGVVDVVRQFLQGAGMLGRGLGLVLRSPRLLGLGLLPALISGILYTVGLMVLIDFLPELSRQVTWFADGWSEFWRDLMRVLAGVGLLGLAALLGILTFTAVTLLIGDPFYERISELVEDRFGGVPGEVEVGFWRSLGRSLVDSLRLIGLSILVGVPLFALGFVPIIGQTVIPVLGATVGGWLLAVELTGVPFQRRGKRLRHRRADLRTRRPLALGFGVAVFCCFLLPLGAILLMPAAIAGATLLSRAVLGNPLIELASRPAITAQSAD